MPFRQHVSASLKLEQIPSPWPRMILSSLSVTLPLILGYMKGDLRTAIYGALFGFILILNDHFGPIGRRILHLVTAYLFIVSGVLVGVLLADSPWLLIVALFCMAYILGRAKGFGLELERMLLFTSLQLLAASQSPEIGNNLVKLLFYTTFSLSNYIVCLFIVYLFMRHAPNFQKSKREVLREAWKKKTSQRYALTMAVMACIGLFVAQSLHVQRGYWVVGTILIVMVPDRYQTLYRSFQRILGTFLGGVISITILRFVWEPVMLIPFCALMAFFAPLGLMKNYWLGNVFIASLILLFLELAHFIPNNSSLDLAIIRFTDIALGSGIGAVGTLIAFPEIFKRRRILKDE